MMRRLGPALLLLSTCLCACGGGEEQGVAPTKVERHDTVNGEGQPLSDTVIKRLFEDDLCVAVEAARIPQSLGFPMDTEIFTKSVNVGARKSCRFAWDDAVGGPNFSLGYDVLKQGDTKKMASDRDSMRRRQERFTPVEIPGVAGFWDQPKTTLYWYPDHSHFITVHVGQAQLDNPQQAAIQVVKDHLVQE